MITQRVKINNFLKLDRELLFVLLLKSKYLQERKKKKLFYISNSIHYSIMIFKSNIALKVIVPNFFSSK